MKVYPSQDVGHELPSSVSISPVVICSLLLQESCRLSRKSMHPCTEEEREGQTCMHGYCNKIMCSFPSRFPLDILLAISRPFILRRYVSLSSKAISSHRLYPTLPVSLPIANCSMKLQSCVAPPIKHTYISLKRQISREIPQAPSLSQAPQDLSRPSIRLRGPPEHPPNGA